MSTSEILVALTEWEILIRRTNDFAAKAKEIFGFEPHTPFCDLLQTHNAAYTKLLSKVIGDSDGWLEWFQYENDMGAKDLEAKAWHWTESRPIKDLNQLAQLIADSRMQ